MLESRDILRGVSIGMFVLSGIFALEAIDIYYKQERMKQLLRRILTDASNGACRN